MNRIAWIDEAKGFGILLVMLGHCYLDNKFIFWFYSFHMALFFMLSGYTNSCKGKYKDYLIKKIRTLLVPYCFLALVTILCNAFISIVHSGTYDWFGVIKDYIFQIRYTPLWFLTCLFIAEQLFYLINIINRKIDKDKFWILSFATTFIIFALYRKFVNINLFWNADLAILAVSFMCFGKYIRAKKWLEQTNNKNQAITLLIASVITITLSWINLQYFGRVDWYANEFGNILIFAVTAITGTLAMIEFTKLIPSKLISWIGCNSLVFFGLNRVIIDVVFIAYNKIDISANNGSFETLILALIAIVVTLLILTPFNMIVLKIMPWCLGKKRVCNK